MEQRKSLGKEAGEKKKKKKTVSQTQVFLLTLIFFSFTLPQLLFLPHTKSNVLCLSPTPTGSPSASPRSLALIDYPLSQSFLRKLFLITPNPIISFILQTNY